MDLDLDDFADAVRSRAAQWQNAGVHWQLHHGATYGKSAAWVDCIAADREARLTVWTSGEAEVDVVDWTTDRLDTSSFEFHNDDDLSNCLDDLTERLTSPRSRA